MPHMLSFQSNILIHMIDSQLTNWLCNTVKRYSNTPHPFPWYQMTSSIFCFLTAASPKTAKSKHKSEQCNSDDWKDLLNVVCNVSLHWLNFERSLNDKFALQRRHDLIFKCKSYACWCQNWVFDENELLSALFCACLDGSALMEGGWFLPGACLRAL